MDLATTARSITELAATATPTIARLDDGPPLHGRVAILPSAFNPPTDAHLALLTAAVAAAGADAGATLLSIRNVDKGDEGASMPERVHMLALAGAPAILASNAALIAEQAHALRQTFPEVEWTLVVGHDTLVRLFEPRYYGGPAGMHAALGDFFLHHRVVSANRGPGRPSEVFDFLRRPEVERYRGKIVPVAFDVELATVSSTAARNAAAYGQPIPGVPVAVAGYMTARGLYRR